MSTHIAANENSRLKIVLASLVGTSIEYYDFYAYLTASLLVFPILFFPHESFALAQLSSLATFGLAFFARPFGAILFGHFGDKYGRKNPLIASLLTMGVATFFIGCLPTVDAWAGAPFALAILRLAQGVGLGGEWSGAALIAVENAPKERRGLYGTLPQFGAPIGFLLSNLLFVLLYFFLPQADFMTWGWRIPFLLSAVLVIFGLLLRVRLTESITYQRLHQAAPAVALPLIEALRTSPGRMLRGIGALLAPYAIFYLITTFALSYATAPTGYVMGQKQGLGFSVTDALLMLLVGTVFQAGLVAASGLLADRFGRRTTLLIALSGIFIFGSVFGIWLASATNTVDLMLFLIVGFILTGLVSGPIGSFLPELFPTNVRYTASALVYNVAGIIGAGILPVLAYSLWQRNGSIEGVSLMLGLVTLVSLLSLLGLRDARKTELAEITGDSKRKLWQRRMKEDAEEGFTVLELLVVLLVVAALAGILIPVYLNARADSISDSVEDSVHGTQQYVSQDILVNYRTSEFDEKTLPPRDIVSQDGAVVTVTGLDGSGAGTIDGYEIRAYNPNSSRYKDPRNAYIYVSTTGYYGIATNVDATSL